MEIKTIVTVIIAGMLGAVVFAGLLPAFAETSSATDTFTNDEYYATMDKIDANSTHTITWAKDTSTKITVDGVDIFPDWSSITIVAEEDNLIRCSKSSTPGSDEYYLNFVGADRPVGAGSISDKSVTISISGGVITFTGVTSADATYTFTSTFTSGYVINPNNEGQYQYVMKTPSAKAYVLGDSEIYGIGYSVVGGAWQNIFVVSGTINNGLNVELVSTTLETDPVISNETTVYNTVSGYVDLYQFEKETFNATYDETTTALTYSFVIVPSEVTAEKEIHPDGPTTALLNLLPVLIAIGLILGIAGAIFIKRM